LPLNSTSFYVPSFEILPTVIIYFSPYLKALVFKTSIFFESKNSFTRAKSDLVIFLEKYPVTPPYSGKFNYVNGLSIVKISIST